MNITKTIIIKIVIQDLSVVKNCKLHNRGKLSEYKNKKFITVFKLRLIKITGNRLYQALKGKV